jgi:hypothetical protein
VGGLVDHGRPGDLPDAKDKLGAHEAGVLALGVQRDFQIIDIDDDVAGDQILVFLLFNDLGRCFFGVLVALIATPLIR